MKPIFLFTIFSALMPLFYSNIRFKDDEMMKAHHHHKTFFLENAKLPNFKTNEEDQIRVHLIPHSHNDVGWLKTASDYFWGTNKKIQAAHVQLILDSIVSALESDPNKKFVYVEVFYFMKWWNQQKPEKKTIVKNLVKNGQLEFINGGFCMNDEATTHFEDIIDQMTLGHKFLKDVFNITVSIGWHLDPFGHSSTQANIFAEMGFDALFFARVDYQDKQRRIEGKNMEMLWKPIGSKDNQGLFSAITYFHYSAPPGFCFDDACDEEPIVDDEDNENSNINWKAMDLVEYFKNMALHYKQNELMHVIGDDFHYANAFKYFGNIDRLISYINDRPQWGVKLFYSTPSSYVKEINKLNIKYEVKTDDFMPYADAPNAYWTGYYVSRPKLKGMIKEAGRFLQIVRTLFALSQFSGTSSDIDNIRQDMMLSVYELEKAMAIMQHHDAIAGTSVQSVADDYANIVKRGMTEAINTLLQFVAKKNTEILKEDLKHEICDWNNFNINCSNLHASLTKNQTLLVTIYNSGSTRLEVIRVKLPKMNYEVMNNKHFFIPSQLVCKEENGDCTLYFEANLELNSFSHFKIRKSNEGQVGKMTPLIFPDGETEKSFLFDNNNGIKISSNLQNFTYIRNGHESSFKLSYKHFRSNGETAPNSGHYIFRPDKSTREGSIPYATPKIASVFEGSILTEIMIESDNIKTNVRIFKSPEIFRSAIEVETFVDSIDISETGKEVTINVETAIKNEKEFYTDSNGLHMQPRKVNYRETWELNVSEPVSGNYYPVNPIISFNDSNQKLSILNDRPQGGSSYREGELELMIHRRLKSSDERGVSEVLDEKENSEGLKVRMKHYLVFDAISGSEDRKLQFILDSFPLVMLANSSNNTFLKSPSPQNLKMMIDHCFLKENVRFYLKDVDNQKFLLRFMNNDPFKTQKFNVNYDLEELSLSASQTKKEMLSKRLKWNRLTKAELIKGRFLEEKETNIVLNTIELKPLQIRTFYLKKKHGIKEIHPNEFIFDLKVKKRSDAGKFLRKPEQKK